jgi:hypothetical protein
VRLKRALASLAHFRQCLGRRDDPHPADGDRARRDPGRARGAKGAFRQWTPVALIGRKAIPGALIGGGEKHRPRHRHRDVRAV